MRQQIVGKTQRREWASEKAEKREHEAFTVNLNFWD